MHRLFVALRPPLFIRTLLCDMMEGVAHARWQSDDQIHVTLRFIGEVDSRTAEDIGIALRSVRHPVFDITLDGIGTFARKGQVDTLWAGLSPTGALSALHKKIDHGLVRIGLPPEARAYRPHLTLARFGRHGGDVSGFAARHAGLTSAPFRIESFGLFESRLGSTGARYEQQARYPLA